MRGHTNYLPSQKITFYFVMKNLKWKEKEILLLSPWEHTTVWTLRIGRHFYVKYDQWKIRWKLCRFIYDGQAAFKNMSCPRSEHMNKNSSFKMYGLEIILEFNQKSCRLSWYHFQPQRGNLQAITQTRQQGHSHKCTIKPYTKHN